MVGIGVVVGSGAWVGVGVSVGSGVGDRGVEVAWATNAAATAAIVASMSWVGDGVGATAMVMLGVEGASDGGLAACKTARVASILVIA